MPTDEQIQTAAYFIWRERMLTGEPGTAESDWLDACEQIERHLDAISRTLPIERSTGAAA